MIDNFKNNFFYKLARLAIKMPYPVDISQYVAITSMTAATMCRSGNINFTVSTQNGLCQKQNFHFILYLEDTPLKATRLIFATTKSTLKPF